jgi:mannose-6-phosphate isomerase-like protein (cupin superfamily)
LRSRQSETRETLNVDEARIEKGVPTTAGWLVINAADARWMHNEMRAVCKFGGDGPTHYDHLGIGLHWIGPGKPMTLYHHEAGQEDFLVLRGECILVIEGEERALGAWDFVHCPPGTSQPGSPPPVFSGTRRG